LSTGIGAAKKLDQIPSMSKIMGAAQENGCISVLFAQRFNALNACITISQLAISTAALEAQFAPETIRSTLPVPLAVFTQ
jgi:hypothetical protein